MPEGDPRYQVVLYIRTSTKDRIDEVSGGPQSGASRVKWIHEAISEKLARDEAEKGRKEGWGG
jgi:hypothetical protein